MASESQTSRPVHGLSDRAWVGPPTRLPYRVRTVGRNARRAYHATLGTHHGDAMITLVIAGRGWYRGGGEARPLAAGDVVLVTPDREAGIIMADPADPYDHFYCRFAGSEALRTAGRIVTERADGEAVFAWDAWRDGAALMGRMRVEAAWDPAPADRITPTDAMLAELLAMLDYRPPAAGRALTGEVLRQYMIDHIAEPNDLSAAAGHFGVSRSHLCREARRLLGTTLVGAWQAMRLEWARILLGEASLSVGEVARRVGYADAFYFSRVFREQCGLSPRQWRKTRA